MSHIHSLGGAYNAAAEYQAFLEQLKSSRQTEREELVRARTQAAEPEEESTGEGTDGGRREAEAEADPTPDSEVEGDSGEPGSHKTYA